MEELMIGDPFIESSGNIEPTSRIDIKRQKDKSIKRDAGEDSEENTDENDEIREIATKEEFITALEAAYINDKNLQVKLLYSTLSKIRYYCFKDEVNELTAEDAVQNVIELVITGKRNWNKKRFKSVVHYLLVAIHSYVRNESKKKPDWKSEDIYDANGNLKENEIGKFFRQAIATDLSEELFKDKLENLITKLMNKLEDTDEDAFCVLDEILKNDTEKINDEILAHKLGIDLHKFKLAKRRLRYAADQLIKKITN